MRHLLLRCGQQSPPDLWHSWTSYRCVHACAFIVVLFYRFVWFSCDFVSDVGAKCTASLFSCADICSFFSIWGERSIALADRSPKGVRHECFIAHLAVLLQCPPCLDYLRSCALILLRLWCYINHIPATYLLFFDWRDWLQCPLSTLYCFGNNFQ